MNNLKAAAQQALEALDEASNLCTWDGFGIAAAALRAALAEPQTTHWVGCEAVHPECAALAEPVQEPVAWLSRDEARFALWDAINRREFGNPTDDKLILEHLREHGLWIGRINTAPPQRKPLTNEEIEKLRKKTFSTNNPYCPVDSKSMWKAARAIERAHGIGGQDE